MAVPPAPDQSTTLTERPDDTPAPAATFRLVLAGVLAAVLVASLGVSVWLSASRGFEAVGVDGGAGELQTERDQVMGRTRQFMLRMGTYGPDQLEDGTLPAYRDLVTEVITPKFATSFDEGGRDLPHYLEKLCQAPYNVKPPRDGVEYLLRTGRAVVILDGLDEESRALGQALVSRAGPDPRELSDRALGYEIERLILELDDADWQERSSWNRDAMGEAERDVDRD